MVVGYSGLPLYAVMSCDGLKGSDLNDTPTLEICQSHEKYLDEKFKCFLNITTVINYINVDFMFVSFRNCF